MGSMVHGQSSVNAQNLVVVEFNEGLANATVLLHNMVESHAPVHLQKQEIAVANNVLVSFTVYLSHQFMRRCNNNLKLPNRRSEIINIFSALSENLP